MSALWILGAVFCVLMGFLIVAVVLYLMIRGGGSHTRPSSAQVNSVREHLRALQVKTRGSLTGDTLKFTYRDHLFRVALTPPRNKNNGSIVVAVNAEGSYLWPERYLPASKDRLSAEPEVRPHLPMMKMRRETGVDRIGKWLRLNKEVQTGDREFDERVYVETDVDVEFAHRLLSQPALRGSAGQCLSMGYQHVTIFEKHDPVQLWGPVKPALLEPEAFWGLMDGLVESAQGLPPIRVMSPEVAFAVRDNALLAFSLLGACFIGLSAMIILLGWRPYQTFGGDDVTLGLWMGVALWFLSTFWAVWLYRGRSTALRMVLTVSIAAMFIGPSIGCLTTNLSNGMLDWSEGSVVVAKVLDKWISKNDDSTTYYARFRVEGLPDAEFKVSRSVFDDLPDVGGQVKMRVHDGLWGWSWVAEFML